MEVVRRAGASRLIDWTGERCVPWTPDVQVAYEHYHRYLWAASLTKGRQVLDLGSGEGFGSAILAGEAAGVQGIDIDQRTVEHSRLNYKAPNLEFHVGSALDLSAFGDDAFDAVVSFEVLEHLVEQERMLAEIDRVLAPRGLLIMSTPDRRMYSDATSQDNPYHERELSEAEFRALLRTRFSSVALWGQRTMCGSRLSALEQDAGTTSLALFVERAGDEWRRAGEPVAMYLVALASREPLDMPAAESTLVDHGIELVREHERDAALARADATVARDELAVARHELEVARHELAVAHDELEVARHEREVANAAIVAAQQREATVQATVRQSMRSARDEHRAEVQGLNRQLAAAVADVAERESRLAVVHSRLARVDASVTWSAFQFVRWRVYRVIGEHSAVGRSLQWVLQRVARLRRRVRAAQAPAPVPVAVGVAATASARIRFLVHPRPTASIVIAAHTGAALTEACLRAISANTEAPTYEVIVVDDCGDADNARLWATLVGARVIVNDSNQGYLRSVNIGAVEARGRYVVALNNDTVVQPGWLSALVDRAAGADDVGVVAPKLLYPDGSVQEAGAIVFQDGSGWNYGRGLDPAAAAFNYVRDVDYGSGACLLVRADLWRELGGYDERYLPMYYEDTDLCFAARALGWRVVYEPAAVVVHLEGGTAGTDAAAGGKRHQELNRPKFVEKWREQLAEQPPASPENVRWASDRNRGPRVLVVDHQVPWPDRDSGSLRMKHLLSSLAGMGCRVTFIPDNLSPIQPYTRELQELGIEVLYGFVDIGPEIATIGRDLRLAIVSRPVIAPRYFDVIREHCPQAILAYDTVDLHFVREERRAAIAGGSTRKAATLRELELGLIRGADVTITVTEAEREVVQSHVPDASVIVIPNANVVAEVVCPPGPRKGVLFVGGFDHPPNADAVLELVQTVMPLVWRELGPVAVKIVGCNAPAEVLALAGPDVEIVGWVKDLTPLYDNSRVMVAPLLYGAGMKGKVTQSLAAGLPVVTTPVGAEGLDAVDGRDMLIAEDPADIAERTVMLLRDDELWTRLSQAGQDVARRVFAPEIMHQRLEELLGAAVVSP